MDGRREPAQTLVFFDVEATGLPSLMPRRHINITELAMVAIRRENFKAPFRYLDRMTVCTRPRYTISSGASEITGLHNEELECHPQFDEVAGLIRQFLDVLPKPVCLLAHNGNRFDFPLFRAELLRASADDIAVVCCDTLSALRHVVSTGIVDADVIREEAELSKLDESFWTAFEECNIFDEASHVTPPRHRKTRPINLIPKKKDRDEESPPYSNGRQNVRRSLFGKEAKRTCQETEEAAKPTPKKSRQGYSLADVYELFFGESVPSAHSAEGDCLALARACHHVKDAFLQYVDDHYVPLQNVTPMW